MTRIRILILSAAIIVVPVFAASDTAAAQSLAAAYCSATKSYGIAKGDSEGKAAEVALRHCNGAGGSKQPGCCEFVKATDVGCIAIAVGPSGKHGVDTGLTQMEAISAAVEECPERGCVAKMARCLD
jgi:hypothetical protein